MKATQRGRVLAGALLTMAAVGGLGISQATGQQANRQGTKAKNDSPAAASTPADSKAPRTQPPLVATGHPTDPREPIALVNGMPISRQQLNDECVARHGTEVLETLIARLLVEQALKDRKVQVTPAEIDEEIHRNAAMAGVDREAFLRLLAKERKISPAQYARDIAYPSIALRKLAEPRVQVTDKDIDEGFAASYGEKLKCRVIMVKNLTDAKEVWNHVRNNPGGFARVAQERSIDRDSAALGGQLVQPITRFAYPRNVSEAAFRQLVDGDPDDKPLTPEEADRIRPKDGDVTGPIQVAEGAWVILMREGLEPGQDFDRNDTELVGQMRSMIQKAKLDAEMKAVMEELFYEAAIDNQLTGMIKPSQEEQGEIKADAQVQPAAAIDDEDIAQEAANQAVQRFGGDLQVPIPVGAPTPSHSEEPAPPADSETNPPSED